MSRLQPLEASILFSMGYGAAAGALFGGILIAPLLPVGAVLGALFGAAGGFLTGLIGGLARSPVGWTVGGVVGGLMSSALLVWRFLTGELGPLIRFIPAILGGCLGLVVGIGLQKGGAPLPHLGALATALNATDRHEPANIEDPQP